MTFANLIIQDAVQIEQEVLVSNNKLSVQDTLFLLVVINQGPACVLQVQIPTLLV